MKQMRFWDSVSTMLVLFGFGLYGSSYCYGVWTLVYAALGCIYHSRCDHCPVYAALSVLPQLSRYDVLFRKENILSALQQ